MGEHTFSDALNVAASSLVPHPRCHVAPLPSKAKPHSATMGDAAMHNGTAWFGRVARLKSGVA